MDDGARLRVRAALLGPLEQTPTLVAGALASLGLSVGLRPEDGRGGYAC